MRTSERPLGVLRIQYRLRLFSLRLSEPLTMGGCLVFKSIIRMSIFTVVIQVASLSEAERRPMTVDDALEMVTLGDVTISPDGGKVFYSERRLRWNNNDYVRQFFIASTKTGDRNQLVVAPGGSDFHFSPKGEYLSYLREQDGKKQLFVQRLGAEDAQQLTHHKTGVESYCWSGREDRLCFTALEPRSDLEQQAWDTGGDAVFVGEGANGLDAGRWSNLWLLDVVSEEVRRVTDQKLSINEFDVSRDAKNIVFVGVSDNRPNFTDVSSELYLVDVESSTVSRLTVNQTPEFDPRFSPDGQLVAYHSSDDDFFDLRNGYIWVMDLNSKTARRLNGQKRGTLMGGLTWNSDGTALLYAESHGVNTNLFRIELQNGKATALTNVSGTLFPKAFSSDRSRVVYTLEDFRSPPDLYISDLFAQDRLRLTNTNPKVSQEVLLGNGRTVHWTSNDGTNVEGVLVLPPTYREGQPMPLMMTIHGGPTGAFINRFRSDFHIYAGLGFAAFGPNPRGSSNYGDEFLRALMGDVGGGEFEDIMSGVDHLITEQIVDPNRMALRGWSWGAILGAWTTAHTNRFRAASLGGMVGDWASETGGGVMWDIRLHYIRGDPWTDHDEWRKRSAITYIDAVRTPTLLLHGEDDDICTVNQSIAWYYALRDRGVPVRLIKFPRQGHAITEPRLRRIADVEEIRWVHKHVLDNEWKPWERATD